MIRPDDLRERIFRTDKIIIEGRREWSYSMNQVFFACHVAEIAKSYAQAIEDNRDNPCRATADVCNEWRKLFEEWSIP